MRLKREQTFVSAGVQMAVFVYMSTPTETVIPYLCALAAQQAVLHTPQSAPLPPAGSFDNGGGGSRDQDITA